MQRIGQHTRLTCEINRGEVVLTIGQDTLDLELVDTHAMTGERQTFNLCNEDLETLRDLFLRAVQITEEGS